MQTFVATLILFLLAATGMALGLIFSNRSLRGSCGGTGKDCSCSETDQKKCALKKKHQTHAGAH